MSFLFLKGMDDMRRLMILNVLILPVKRTTLSLLCLVFLVGLICLLSVPAHAQSQSQIALNAKDVLVLYSEDKAHPAHKLTDKGIRSAFRSNKLFEVRQYNEYLDISRFRDPGHVRVMADYLNRKYAGTRIDAIITVYPAAMEFLHEGKLFPGVPIVACEIIRATAEKLDRSPWRSSTTGTIQGDNAARLVESALRLRPGTKRAALVVGTAPTDAYSELVIRNGLKPYAGKIELIDLTKLPMQETLARVGSLPPDTIVLYAAIFRDGANQVFVPREALSLISAAANAPVFGLYESYMGYGVVGGRLDSYEMHGR
jgi:hypothetical protein